MAHDDPLRVGIAQIAPVWLDRQATLARMAVWVGRAAEAGCRLLAFGEALVPGYPFWLERTGGARFESPRQQRLHARYLDQAVSIGAGHLDGLRSLAERHQMALVIGCVERPLDRGGHSLYCALVTIDPTGAVASVHRKLMPTHEERLCWGTGDGHGLRTHALGGFTLGSLNCWENWMPLARHALYAQGEDLHVAVWPGSLRNTRALTPVIAREGRSFVLSASGLMRPDDVPPGILESDEIGDVPFADGGSCIAGPDGEWVVEPVIGEASLLVADLFPARVREARQSFDPAGHYARPDVLRLVVDRTRQSTLEIDP